jgi:hypothetical protein
MHYRNPVLPERWLNVEWLNDDEIPPLGPSLAPFWLLDSGEVSLEKNSNNGGTFPRLHLRVRTVRSTYTKNRILNRLSPRTEHVE